MEINKDTVLCGSFAGQAGNFGATVFNAAFRMMGINAIYKPFSVQNIEGAIMGMRMLNIRGAGVTMPFKREAIQYVDKLERRAREIGAINTIVNTNGVMKGHNTDYVAAKKMLAVLADKRLVVLGNGGFARAVIAAAHDVGFNYVRQITRETWEYIPKILQGSLVFNCTPVKREDIQLRDGVDFIDCDVTTPTGRMLALLQAAEQFRLYTGIKFPFSEKSILEGKVGIPCA